MNNYNIDAQARGERIRKLRLKKNKTQAYFADILYISPSYLALIEAGKRVPNLDVLVHIAEITDVSIDYLIFGDNKEPNSLQLTLERLNKSYPQRNVEHALMLAEYYLKLEKRTFRYQRFYKLIFFPIANLLPYFYNIPIPYFQMQHIKKGDFQWTLFQKFLRLSQATRGR